MTVTINGTTGVAGVDGTASTPAIQGNDTNTGIFFPAADTIAFAEGGAEVARFDSNGNLGIGTSSPNGKLDVAGTINVSSSNGNTGGIITTSGEASLSNKLVLNGSRGDGGIIFQSNSTERMRLDVSGNLLIGVTSFSNGVNGKSIDGNVFNSSRSLTTAVNHSEFRNPNGQVGTISTSGTSTTYSTSSDYRLKENVQPMTGALATVGLLKPCTYTWKTDGADGQGFIAHELQSVVPDAVVGEKDAVDAEGNPVYQGVDTSFLVATLTAAIQEQQAIITDLKARIETLENK